MARIHGANGQVLMDDVGGTTYVEVGDVNKFTLDMSRDRVDVTAFGDTNKQKVQGLPNFTGTFSGFWNSTNSPRIFDVILGTVAAHLKLVPNRLESGYYFDGLAYLDGSIDVDSGGAATFAGTFDAAGNWTVTP